LVDCFGVAGVHWSVGHILFDGGEAEILSRRSSLTSGPFGECRAVRNQID
jgi:hypothetical protein